MDIKWAYYLIIIIYAILVSLRGINYLNLRAYQAKHPDALKVFCFKKDFFTTVASICILVTIAINGAALLAGKPLNTSSMVITCLVVGFLPINNLTFIRFSENREEIFLLGYILKTGDIEKIALKKKRKKNILNIVFTREIESYNYMKLFLYGKHKNRLTSQLQSLQQVEDK